MSHHPSGKWGGNVHKNTYHKGSWRIPTFNWVPQWLPSMAVSDPLTFSFLWILSVLPWEAWWCLMFAAKERSTARHAPHSSPWVTSICYAMTVSHYCHSAGLADLLKAGMEGSESTNDSWGDAGEGLLSVFVCVLQGMRFLSFSELWEEAVPEFLGYPCKKTSRI